MSRTTIRLTVEVTYEANNTHTSDLEDLLLDLPFYASMEGRMTGDTDAEVVTYTRTAEVLP